MRSRWLPVVVTACALSAALPGLVPGVSRGDERAKSPLMDDETRGAIEQGLRYLARTQRADGAWTSDAGNKVNDQYRVPEGQRNVPHVGVTALGVLAFLAAGHVPGRGPYGVVVEKAVRFLLDNVQSDGMIYAHGTRMYDHAFATLALAEVAGTSQEPSLRKKLTNAVGMTIKCQNSTGAWRYVPHTIESDMSVTVCQVVALRAARNVGVRVPQETIDAALRYVIDSAITDPSAGQGGPFGNDDGGSQLGAFLYQPQDTKWNRSSFSLTAAGLTTLFQAGLYTDKDLEAYVRSHGIRKSPLPHVADTVAYMRRAYASVPKNHFFFFYGNYYAAQAMYNVGALEPEVWEGWYRMVRADLLSRAMRDQLTGPGGVAESRWSSNIDSTGAYATATAILILSIPFDYLPIHQK
jgi:hypothetical protein